MWKPQRQLTTRHARLAPSEWKDSHTACSQAMWNDTVAVDYSEPAEPGETSSVGLIATCDGMSHLVVSPSKDAQPCYRHLEDNEVQRTKLSKQIANKVRKELQVGDKKKNL